MPEAYYVPGTVWGTGWKLPEGDLGFSTGIPHFIALFFIVLCRYCIFYKMKVYGNFALSKFISTIFPWVCTHFLSLSHILEFLQYLKLFHYYCICYGDLWSVIFDVTIVVFWYTTNCAQVGQWAYQRVNIVNALPTDCPTWASVFPKIQKSWN